MNEFKRCPICGRFIVQEIPSTQTTLYMCICGYSDTNLKVSNTSGNHINTMSFTTNTDWGKENT